MADEKPNPLTAHLLNLVQGRQQTEVAKLTLLGKIAESTQEVSQRLCSIEVRLDELVERSRKP